MTGKNGYIAFYKGKRIEVRADTAYDAQRRAAVLFGNVRWRGEARKAYEVTVVLAEKDGHQVTHNPTT